MGGGRHGSRVCRRSPAGGDFRFRDLRTPPCKEGLDKAEAVELLSIRHHRIVQFGQSPLKGRHVCGIGEQGVFIAQDQILSLGLNGASHLVSQRLVQVDDLADMKGCITPGNAQGQCSRHHHGARDHDPHCKHVGEQHLVLG